MLDRETPTASHVSLRLTCRLRDRSHSTLEKSAYTRAPEGVFSIFSTTSIHETYRTICPAPGSGSSSTHLGVNTAVILFWRFNNKISPFACCFVSASGAFPLCVYIPLTPLSL